MVTTGATFVAPDVTALEGPDKRRGAPLRNGSQNLKLGGGLPLEAAMSLRVPATIWRVSWLTTPLAVLALWIFWSLAAIEVLVWQSSGPSDQNLFIVRCTYLGPRGLSTREHMFSFEFFVRLYNCPVLRNAREW
jgi:hypothetical protein